MKKPEEAREGYKASSTTAPTLDSDSEKMIKEPLVAYRKSGPNYFSMASQDMSKDYIKQISKITKLSLGELIQLIPISLDTYKRKVLFGSAVTEKILQIEEVYTEGIEAFGDGFYSWMNMENIALGGAKPKSLLINSFGIRKLLDQIGRIKHGILA